KPERVQRLDARDLQVMNVLCVVDVAVLVDFVVAHLQLKPGRLAHRVAPSPQLLIRSPPWLPDRPRCSSTNAVRAPARARPRPDRSTGPGPSRGCTARRSAQSMSR